MSAADETYDLAVRLRGEQIDETAAELEGVEDSFDDTADSVGDSAEQMEGLSRRWNGAMTAILTGLAVASAGLLAQVPVVGELMGGLGEVIAAVAFQMDQVLRPVLQPLTDALFGIADAIFEMDGPLGTIIGILGTLAAVAGIVIGAAKALGISLGGLAAAKAALVVVGKVVIGILGAIAGALGLPVIAVAALIAAIIALIAIFATDFMGIRTFVIDAIRGIISALGQLGMAIADFFADLVKQALTWGEDLMEMFAEGIINGITAPLSAAEEVRDQLMSMIGFDLRKNDRMAERWGSDMVQHFSTGISRASRMELAGMDISLDSDSGGGGRPASGGTRQTVVLDGRRVDRGTRKHRDDETAPRGRFS